jgi:hypothetical protein
MVRRCVWFRNLVTEVMAHWGLSRQSKQTNIVCVTPLPTSDLIITRNDTNLVLFAHIAIGMAAEVTWKHCIKVSEYISNPRSQYIFLITSVNFNFQLFCSGRSGTGTGIGFSSATLSSPVNIIPPMLPAPFIRLNTASPFLAIESP